MFQLVKGGAVIGILFFALVSFWPAFDKDHKGAARVIDADTIEIDGSKHRLYGVDAVELDQTCRRHDGAEWPCGREAAAALAEFLEGHTVNCDIWQGNARDDYGRFISVCYADGENLSAWIAREGWAVADKNANRLDNYTSQEGMARFLRKGIWTGTFDPPAEWRRAGQTGERP